MPRFAANLTTMFQEFADQEQFRLASACGFHGIELLSPYSHSTATLNEWLSNNNLQLILLNVPPGKTMGMASLPGLEIEFEESFNLALEYAAALDAPMIHVLAGQGSKNREPSRELFVNNIRRAADQAAAHNIRIMLEPINTRDIPDYFHSVTDDTAALINEIDRDNVQLQYDCYHMQIMEGDLCHHIEKHKDIIGHIQFSSLPGRNEPQFGEVNLPHVFEFIDRIGYEGWIGCEYRPHTDTMSGLSWGAPWGIHPPESG